MTSADLKSLSDRELDARLAEALGWTDVQKVAFPSFTPAIFQGVRLIGKDPRRNPLEHVDIPAFSSDLNATYEAEEALSAASVARYSHNLVLLIGFNVETEVIDYSWWISAHSKARQRAEALLLTLHGYIIPYPSEEENT